MRKKTLLTRLWSGAVVVAVATGSALLVSNGLAGANPPPGTLGGNTVSPDPGTNTAAIHSTTGGGCPSPSVKADLKVVGPIGVDSAQQVFPATNPYTAVTITDTQFSNDGAFTQQWALTFQDAVAARLGQTATVPTGEYDFTTRCLDRLGQHSFGTYVGGLLFDTPTTYHALPSASPSPSTSPSPSSSPSPTPTPIATPTSTPTSSPTPTPTPTATPTSSPTPTPTPTATSSPSPSSSPSPAPGAKTTRTRLTVDKVALPFVHLVIVIPSVHVTPSSVDGAVQFKLDGKNLAGRIRLVHGVAVGPIGILPPGQHTVTVEFAPDDAKAFTSSQDTETFSVP